MPANSFVWYELVTTDIDAALAFYRPLLGWEAQDFPGQAERYAIVSAKGKGVGGVMKLPEGVSHPFWLGYVGTTDIDQAVKRFVDGGGALHRAPWEIPDVGRIALVADPQGASLALFQGPPDRPSEAFNQQLPGHGNWNELYTTDPAQALAFYGQQFGWTAGDAIPMGPMGTYQIIKAGDVHIGGIMAAPEGRRPMWNYYFGTPNIHTAASAIKDTGGTVLHGPAEVPGGAKIVQARDPQGAMFALVGPG